MCLNFSIEATDEELMGSEELCQTLSHRSSSEEHVAIFSQEETREDINKNVELPTFWQIVFLRQLGVKSVKALQHIGSESYPHLVRFARTPQDKKTLQKFLKMEGQEHTFQKQRKQQIQQLKMRQDEFERMLQNLSTLHGKSKYHHDEEAMVVEDGIRENLQIPPEFWPSNSTALPEIISQLKDCQKKLSAELQAEELSDLAIVKRASGGRALQGILLTKDVHDQLQERHHLLKPPKDICLMEPLHSQNIICKQFTSRHHEKVFTYTLNSAGYSVTGSEVIGYWGFTFHLTSNQSHRMEQDHKREQETYNSTVQLFVLPLASLYFDDDQLQLSDKAIQELRAIESFVDSCDKSAQTKCEAFFKKFGSHASKGPLHFGGTYQWTIHSSGFKKSDRGRVQQVHNEVIDNLAGESIFRSVTRGGVSRNAYGTDTDTLVCDTFWVITTSGGPQDVTGLPCWKNGLIANNGTWNLIDRGSTLVPIWDIIKKNHAKDFKKPYSLATLMNQAWTKMNHGYTKESKKTSVGDVEKVVHTVESWNDNPHVSHFKGCLSYLVEIKQTVSKSSMDPLFWPTMYLAQPAVHRFLKLVVDKYSSESSEDCVSTEGIREVMKEVVEPLDLYTVKVFPCRKYIRKWLYPAESSMDCEIIMCLHKYFQYALHHMYGGLKRDDSNLIKIASKPDVSIKVTESLARIVCCVRNQLQETGKRYEENFVITMLLPFDYDPEQNLFYSSFSVCDLTYLCKVFQQHCKEFFTVARQQIVIRSQVHLFSLAVAMHNDLCVSKSKTVSHLQSIEQKIGDDIDPQLADILHALLSNKHDLEWFQCQLDSLLQKATEESNQSLPNVLELLTMLGLIDVYPQGLTQQHALEIREDTLESAKDSSKDKKQMGSSRREKQCTNPNLYPFLILQKVMAFDNRCRIKLVCHENKSSSSIEKFSLKHCDTKHHKRIVVHPMDGLIALLGCADNFLRQDLMSRLATCQLAVPLVLPDPVTHGLTYLLWALRSIVKEWKSLHSDSSSEGQLVSYPAPLVSFLRIGKHRISKSQLMNSIISKSRHDIFFHFNCDGGNAKKLLINGLVEICWYLPSINDQIFPDVVTFANLHGDARECSQQTMFLSKVSFINFVFVSTSDLNDAALGVLRTLATAHGGLCLLRAEPWDDNNVWTDCLRTLKESVLEEKLHVIELDMNEADIRGEVYDIINNSLDKEWKVVKSTCTLEKYSNAARSSRISVDEDHAHCLKGKELAIVFSEIIEECKKTHKADSLKDLLPLQSNDLWHEWAWRDKEQYRQTRRGQKNIEFYGPEQREKMQSIREEQVHRSQFLHPLMESFLSTLLFHQAKIRHYFLQWVRMILDNLSREQLPCLHNQYKQKRSELNKVQPQKVKEEQTKELELLNLKIIRASFGLEHLLREICQIYEAVAANKKATDEQIAHVSCLPEVAAELMIEGYPLELMDGDAAHVPKFWISAVMNRLEKHLNNPTLFVLSILGLQSSGKSTLMNTVFGLKFAASAGRCTRGAFMQLVPIHKSLQQECKCDYFLVVDTEGLRAPELDTLHTHKHDNELATFVIGLANLTVTNLFGEAIGDLDDIIQTAVHAFLRMKKVRLTLGCHFVHQNVSAVMAGEKGMMGRYKFKDKLDLITRAAAEQENLEHQITCFKDLIDFSDETDVTYFPGLWEGDPPMAPINTGYSAKAQNLKSHLISFVNLRHPTHSSELKVFRKKIENLWQAILEENFVFSFKNTLEISAYNTLDTEYSQWSWQFNKVMLAWEQKARNKIHSCDISQLQAEYDQLCEELLTYVNHIHEELKQEMEEVFQNNPQSEIVVKWKGETERRLDNLKTHWQIHAKSHCSHMKSSREALAQVDGMKETHREQILKHVKHFVSELENVKLNDEQLMEKFDEQWSVWIEERKSHPMLRVMVNVKVDVQTCLLDFKPLKASSCLLVTKLEQTPLEKWGHRLHLVFSKKVHLETKRKYPKHFLMMEEVPVEVVQHAETVTVKLLKDQEEYLKQKENEDYNPVLATDLLQQLFKGIAGHSRDIPFTEEYKVDMALTVCGFALKKLQQVVEIARKKNDPVEYLEREMKGPLFRIFKDEYYQIAEEVTAASAVCDLLLRSVKKEVISSLSPDIVTSMKGSKGFFHTKKGLKAKILLDIGEDLDHCKGRNFEDCRLYLKDVDASLQVWVRRYTEQHCSEGNPSRLAKIATDKLNTVVSNTKRAVVSVTDEFLVKGGEFKITEWLSKFHSILNESGNLQLDLTELLQLGGVRQLRNLTYFTEELNKGLDNLYSTLRAEFEDMSVAEIQTWQTRPNDILFKELSGCTEQCPFCKEQCDLTDKNHFHSSSTSAGEAHKHSVTLHRPSCLGGFRWVKSNEMILDICTSLVASDYRFRNLKTKLEFHPYKEYSKFYPEWSITDDTSQKASLYWKWLVGNYKKKIAAEFAMKECEVPSEWKQLKWSDVKNSLKDAYKV